MQIDAVILDELGYLPFPASGSVLLFHLISQLYEKTSLIVTTNLSRLQVGRWLFTDDLHRKPLTWRCVMKRPRSLPNLARI